jgi:hypothetical protein
MNKLVLILPVVTGIVCVFFGTVSGASDERGGAPAAAPERKFPSLPGAIRNPPEWVATNAPFDVVRFFEAIPEDENAAPLYLEALYEFVPVDMHNCIAPEVRRAREEFLTERAVQTGKLQVAKQEDIDPVERAQIVSEYAESFDKLAHAQQRPRCVFETGIGITTLLPHAQSSRQVIRLLDWRVEAHVAEGRIDAALDDIVMGLRLSRDLRPRGFMISQLVSMALDAVVTASLIPKVLASPDLEVAHCERLLDLLTRHANSDLDPFAEGLRMEYVMTRDLLHQIELKQDPIVLAELAGQAKAAADAMGAEDFTVEIALLNGYFKPWIGPGDLLTRGAFQMQPAQQAALEKMKIGRDVLTGMPQFVESCRRHRTRLGATRCLIALRQWQLKSKNANPPDLHVLCKELDIGPVPVDEYSKTGEPLRWALITGEFVIYSVGADGKDDGGRIDWQFGQELGDWIFRLPAVTP